MTVANVIAQYGKPTLVLSHNKTLAAQLYGELKQFFPTTRSSTSSRTTTTTSRRRTSRPDTYIEKDASASTRTSTACGCGHVIADGARGRRHRRHRLGDLRLGRSGDVSRASMVMRCRGAADSARRHPARAGGHPVLRNDVAFERGTFRVRGDTVEIFPAYEEQAVRWRCGATRSSASPRSIR
jgi:excinuclease ABC subunit B